MDRSARRHRLRPARAQIYAGEWNSDGVTNGKEDCLYLNVSTPELKPKKLMPVMFWIHGGGNAAGSARINIFAGEPLAKHGVVVVTIQYRLGLLGFMAHPELTKESPHRSSGNYGVLDQVAALKWVHANIARFGGDPNRITLFGQSAGALDIGLLMVSPLSKGLFIRAIQQSGATMSNLSPTYPLAETEREGQAIAERLGAPAQGSIAFLRSIPANEFIKKAQAPFGQHDGGSPNVDGYFLTADPVTVFEKHEELQVALIEGTTGRELPGISDSEKLRAAIQGAFGDNSGEAMEVYGLTGKPFQPASPAYGSAGDEFVTDTTFRCSAVRTVKYHSTIAPTYQYEFTHPLTGHEAEGATHTSELGFVFGIFAMAPAPEADRAISAIMQSYWTNFAKTGDPNGPGLPKWFPYDLEFKAVYRFHVHWSCSKNGSGRLCLPAFGECKPHQQRAQ